MGKYKNEDEEGTKGRRRRMGKEKKGQSILSQAVRPPGISSYTSSVMREENIQTLTNIDTAFLPTSNVGQESNPLGLELPMNQTNG